MQHPSGMELSAWLDGEGDADERRALEAHLSSCASCAGAVDELGSIVQAARALEPSAPGADLWPAISRGISDAPAFAEPVRAGRPAWLAPFAAALLASASTWAVLEIRTPAATGASAGRAGGTYLLLLHEAPELVAAEGDEEQAAVAARYGRWAQGLGERCLGGEELAAEGYALRPGAAPAVLEPSSGGARPDRPDRIGGYFLVETETREEAVQLAQSCPHLERGGWIELRPIQVR